MLNSKQLILKPLLDSKDGIHLTAYLVNRKDLIDLKSQVRTSIDEADDWISQVMSADERHKFFEPLDALLHDARIFNQMKGNIGLFRNKDSFRVLNIPIDVVQSCQVATSFHIKPLLRWLQSDEEFLLLGIEKDFANLYIGTQTTFKLVHSIHAENFFWLQDWVTKLTKLSKPKLFVAGRPAVVGKIKRTLDYIGLVQTAVCNSFNRNNAGDVCQIIRGILKDEGKKNLERSLLEFRLADEGNRAKKNIFQIAKAVVQGKVRKLIVTDELNIFGKIDIKSGGLAIHPFDMDHEDDCILDDLAQMVLSQGGEVVIAKRDEIPKGRPILAILEDEALHLDKTEKFQYEVLEERFG